jgi:hypothetical protein
MGTPKNNSEETLFRNLQIYGSYNRVKRSDVSWSPVGNMSILPRTKVGHGLCLDCCEQSLHDFAGNEKPFG